MLPKRGKRLIRLTKCFQLMGGGEAHVTSDFTGRDISQSIIYKQDLHSRRDDLVIGVPVR